MSALVVLAIVAQSALAGIVYGLLLYVFYKRVERNTNARTLTQETLKETNDKIKNLRDILGGNKMIENNNTLTDLIMRKPTEDAYKEYTEKFGKLVAKLYKDYQFVLHKPFKDGQEHMLQMQIISHEDPEAYDELFKIALDNNLDAIEISKHFADFVELGGVVDLGEDVVILKTDSRGRPLTGSTSIVQSKETLSVNISFILKEHYDKWAEENLQEDNG